MADTNIMDNGYRHYRGGYSRGPLTPENRARIMATLAELDAAYDEMMRTNAPILDDEITDYKRTPLDVRRKRMDKHI